MKKAQMSLEMIIGLLILLVVAVVVIRMFLSSTEGVNEPWENVKTGLKWKEFKSGCEADCNEFKISGSKATLAKYCFTKLKGDTDLNRNGMIDSLPADTKILEVCEDGIYCFHVYECKTEDDTIDWDDCRRLICNEYYSVFEDWNKANEKVRELFPNSGTCDLKAGENWWEMYNYGPGNPCTGGEEFSLTSLTSCSIDNTDPANPSFTCDADFSGSCSDADVGVAVFNSDFSKGAFVAALDETSSVGSISFDENNNRFSGTLGFDPAVPDPLPSGENCYFYLFCGDAENPVGELDISSGKCTIS